MSEGDLSDESAVPAAPTDPEPNPEPKQQAPRGRKVLVIAAALVGLGIPLGVGILAFMNPTAAAGEPSPEDAVDNSVSVKDLEDVVAVAYPSGRVQGGLTQWLGRLCSSFLRRTMCSSQTDDYDQPSG